MPSVNKVKDWYAQSFEVCDSYQPILTPPNRTDADYRRKSPNFPGRNCHRTFGPGS